MTTNLTTWNYRLATLDAFGLEPEPDGDGRPDMEYGVTYVRQSICTICGSEGGPDPTIFVTKQHHELHPLGHLIARCPAHQDQYEASQNK